MFPWEVKSGAHNKSAPVCLFMVYNHPEKDGLAENVYYGYFVYQSPYHSNHTSAHEAVINLNSLFHIIPTSFNEEYFLPFGHPDSLRTVPSAFWTEFYGLIIPGFNPDWRNAFWLHSVSSNWNEYLPNLNDRIRNCETYGNVCFKIILTKQIFHNHTHQRKIQINKIIRTKKRKRNIFKCLMPSTLK